jgi:hypothetical protein
MADEDIEELKKELRKLKPKDKIKRLKELGKKRKTEMTEIEHLIKDFEKELKTDKVAEEISPQPSEIDLTRLFEEEAGRLEKAIKKEVPVTEEGDLGYIPFKQIYSDYTQLQDIAYASMTGSLNESHMDVIDKIGERLDRTKYESASKEVADLLVASRSTLYKIRKYAGIEKSNF